MIWTKVLHIAHLPIVSPTWTDVMGWLLPLSKHNTITSIVSRIIVAVSSYFLWKERNNHIHGKGEKKHEDVTNMIVDVVRLKIASVKFKRNVRIEELMRTWKISNAILNGN
ncbi:hypothetical protein Tco_0034361 [Tanacetum coccineum]